MAPAGLADTKESRPSPPNEALLPFPVEFVSLAEAFCRPQCETVRDGHLLYHDDDHLSRYAAERILGPYLRTRLWPVTNPAGPGPRQGEREAQRPLYHPPADQPRTGRAPTPP